MNHLEGSMGHAAMVGDEAPAVGGPTDLDALLYPPPALPYEPGRLREYMLTATDTELEVAPGVFFPAWVYNGTAPGPVIRATEGDVLRVNFVNAGSHRTRSTSRDPSDEDGRRLPDRRSRRSLHVRVRGSPGGHAVVPLPLHAAEEAHPQGLYGAFIIDPGAATVGQELVW